MERHIPQTGVSREVLIGMLEARTNLGSANVEPIASKMPETTWSSANRFSVPAEREVAPQPEDQAAVTPRPSDAEAMPRKGKALNDLQALEGRINTAKPSREERKAATRAAVEARDFNPLHHMSRNEKVIFAMLGAVLVAGVPFFKDRGHAQADAPTPTSRPHGVASAPAVAGSSATPKQSLAPAVATSANTASGVPTFKEIACGTSSPAAEYDTQYKPDVTWDLVVNGVKYAFINNTYLVSIEGTTKASACMTDVVTGLKVSATQPGGARVYDLDRSKIIRYADKTGLTTNVIKGVKDEVYRYLIGNVKPLAALVAGGKLGAQPEAAIMDPLNAEVDANITAVAEQELSAIDAKATDPSVQAAQDKAIVAAFVAQAKAEGFDITINLVGEPVASVTSSTTPPPVGSVPYTIGAPITDVFKPKVDTGN